MSADPQLVSIPANINEPSARAALYEALLPCPTCDAGQREPYSGMWKDEHRWHEPAYCWTCNNTRAVTLAAIAAQLEERRSVAVERDIEAERADRAEAFWYEILAALIAVGMAMNQATDSSGIYVHTPVGRTDAFPTYGEALKAALQALIDRAVSTSQTGLKFPTHLAGTATKVMLFMCESCHTCTARWENSYKIAEEDATRMVRSDGWSKTKDGWRCPSCVQRRKGSKQA